MSRVESLISRMTLTEKLGQLTMTACGMAVTGPTIAGDSTEAIKSGEIGNLLNLLGTQNVREMQDLAVKESRLGIPLLIGYDVIHGHRILFPIPLGEASCFDPEVWEQSARESAKEAAADGLAMTFAPMLDVARDPRWGRIAEGPGEDPLVGARMAEAKVRGFQGADLRAADALAACAKHFCAYGCVTAGRDYAPVDISDRTLHEVHMLPFAAAVSAGVAAIMPAFTDLNGVPMTANRAMLRDWLRGRFGFDGVVISDYNAIAELIRHGVAADLAEAAALALKAGVDIDMMADAYRHGLPVALKRGAVSVAEIDQSVRRVLMLKERLGLFEDPYRRGKSPESPAARTQRRQLARQIAARSIVMLKNEGDALPISRSPTAPRRDRPFGGRVGRNARRVVGRSPARGSGDRARGSAQRVPRGRDPAFGRGCNRERGFQRHRRRRRGLRARGCDHPLLGRSGGHERRSLEPRASGIARHATTACRSRIRTRAALRDSGDRDLVFRAAPGRAVAGGARRRGARGLVSGQRGGQCDRRCALGTGEPQRANAGDAGRVRPVKCRFFLASAPAVDPSTLRINSPASISMSRMSPCFRLDSGCTYGRFELSNLRLSSSAIGINDALTIQVDVINRGAREAQETVFLFTHDKVASVSRPKLELKSFGKISLAPGKSGTVTLSLRAAELCFLDMRLEPLFESGEVEILLGSNADRAQMLAATIQLLASCPCDSKK